MQWAGFSLPPRCALLSIFLCNLWLHQDRSPPWDAVALPWKLSECLRNLAAVCLAVSRLSLNTEANSSGLQGLIYHLRVLDKLLVV